MRIVDAPACAVGRLHAGGPWVGFAPTLDDGYALVVGTDDGTARAPAGVDDVVALALAYFEDELGEPPEELAATHADIGALVRHAAEGATTTAAHAALMLAVDAIDDGLGADAVIERLSVASPAGANPGGHLMRRAAELLEG